MEAIGENIQQHGISDGGIPVWDRWFISEVNERGQARIRWLSFDPRASILRKCNVFSVCRVLNPTRGRGRLRSVLSLDFSAVATSRQSVSPPFTAGGIHYGSVIPGVTVDSMGERHRGLVDASNPACGRRNENQLIRKAICRGV